jgi:DNA-binding response OmpR family regulator
MASPSSLVSDLKAVIAEHHDGENVLLFDGPDGLQLDLVAGTVTARATFALTPTETKLLAALILANGRPLSRIAAFDALYWDRGETGEPAMKGMDKWMFLLRAQLAPLRYSILSDGGLGWRLVKDMGVSSPKSQARVKKLARKRTAP